MSTDALGATEHAPENSHRNGAIWLLVAVAGLLVAGIGVWAKYPDLAAVAWVSADCVALVPASIWVAHDLRRGRYGADLLAVFALAATLIVGEYLAGAVVAVMVASGRLLEAYAGRRASKDLSALLARAPRTAHLRRDNRLDVVAVRTVGPDDRVVVFAGETVPVDGKLVDDGLFDESALSGESAPVARKAGDPVRSGAVNIAAAVDICATATAEDSTYAGVVKLAEDAAAASAPVARLADRIAVWFLPLALVIAGAAWLLSGSATRAVAVLVTATPCPLLLAVPVAITGGMSRMSRAGVVVKGGAAMELLGRAATLAMDKTGTVTAGRPEVTDIVCAPGVELTDALRLAAGIEQYSPHVLAGAIVAAAQQSGVDPAQAEGVSERPGAGASGQIEGRRIEVGRIPEDADRPVWAKSAARRARLDLATLIWVSSDGEPIAAFLVRDRIRSDAVRTMLRLRSAGLRRIILLTGDRVDNAAEVADLLGLSEVQANASPADKIDRVRSESRGGTTVMVGDGVNDAPALAAADVGIALGSRGSTAAVQAADAVIVDDNIDRLADAVEIARRARRLAVQSAIIGTGLSLVAMVTAAFGWLVPIAGAVVQEAIDVAVILNALRVLRVSTTREPEMAALLRRFADEHIALVPARRAVRVAADALAGGATAAADAAVRQAYSALVDYVLPHERAEEHQLYPALAGVLGGPEGTFTMSREHAEIERLVRRIGRHLEQSGDAISADQVDDLRATLYGLDAVLSLHFAQEEEAYFTLVRK